MRSCGRLRRRQTDPAQHRGKKQHADGEIGARARIERRLLQLLVPGRESGFEARLIHTLHAPLQALAPGHRLGLHRTRAGLAMLAHDVRIGVTGEQIDEELLDSLRSGCRTPRGAPPVPLV